MSRLVILITGSNRGIGLEFVRQYIEAGATVLATARHPEAAVELHEIQKTSPEHLHIFKLDVVDEKSLHEAVVKLEAFGRPIDVLINNAGIPGHFDGWKDVKAGEIEDVFRVNCIGPFLVTRALLPHMKRPGKIIYITSLMGSIEDNRSGGSYPYRISKAALNMLGHNFATDFKGEGILTALIHPGWVKTRMGGFDAPTEPAESVRGMRGVIDRLHERESGGFFNFDGRRLPW